MRSRVAILVGIVAVLFSTLIAVRVLSQVGWDPTVYIAFGKEATATTEYANERLGEVYLRAGQGHDGKFFFVQANDPWLLNPEENAEILERPLYRSQRMFYPMLAGGFGLFHPESIVWAMLIVNLLAIGVGTWVVALVAEEMGGSSWWGLAFTLNVGILNEVGIGGAGVIAATAAFAAVLMFMRDHLVAGVGLLVVAALSREVMLLVAGGIAIWLLMERRRRAAAFTVILPGLGVLAWAAYLRLRTGEGTIASEVQEIGWPFVGFLRALPAWLDDPLRLMVGVAMAILLILFTRRVLMSRDLIGWGFIGFVVLGVLLTAQVWYSYFDITRAISPVATSFVLLVFLGSRRGEPSRTPFPVN